MQKIAVLILIIYTTSVIYPDNEILNFWTRDKMLQAKPMSLIMIDKDPLKKTSFINQTIEVPKEDYSKLPFESTGKFFFTFNGESYSCTANSLDKNIIITAGHCVSDGRGSFFKDFMFCPQYYLGECRKGKYPGNKVVTTDEWHRNFYLAKDYSFIKVGKNERNEELSMNVKPLKLVINLPRDQHCIALGYPSNIGGSEKMVQSIGKQSLGHSDFKPPTVRFPSMMTFGSSGGCWSLNNSFINSIVSYGSSRDPNHFYGPYFDQDVEKLKKQLDE